MNNWYRYSPQFYNMWYQNYPMMNGMYPYYNNYNWNPHMYNRNLHNNYQRYNNNHNGDYNNYNNYGNNNEYNGLDYQSYGNNIYDRGENGLVNGNPNNYRQNNLQNNNTQNRQNQNNKQSNNQTFNNYQNVPNGIEENGGNNGQNGENENGQPENKVKTNDELILDYENNLRTEIELTTPLISEDFKIDVLIEEYKDNEEYSKSIENITKKYKYIRKVRRDGNCFYRSFIFRLFEYICIKNQKTLFEKIKQKIVNAKELTTKNGYEWTVVEDFYNLFLKEFTDCFNSLTQKTTIRDYLNNLFKDKNRSNYLIYFIRFCIAAYLKDQRETYQVYIEGSFDDWVRNEVEEIDHEADQIQIMACVNYFEVGVQIEYLNKNQREVVKLPEDKPDEEFFIFLLFTPGHYDILYP